MAMNMLPLLHCALHRATGIMAAQAIRGSSPAWLVQPKACSAALLLSRIVAGVLGCLLLSG
jgi:hypothetical protein